MQEFDIPLIWLRDGDDAREARAMEAGVYAAHLIEVGCPDPRLGQVVELGEAARLRLWWVAIRITRMLAARVGLANGLPPEDLFQDGCLAVAQSIWAYDYARGVRFSTFIHHIVTQELSDLAHYRVGSSQGSRGDRRAARKTVRAMAQDPLATLAEAASSAGVSYAAVLRGHSRTISLDETTLPDTAAQLPFEAVTAQGLDFLTVLSPKSGWLLRLRYLEAPRQPIHQLAARLGVSTSTLSRWLRIAREEARSMLEADRTVLSRGPRSGAACGASPTRSGARTGPGVRSGP